MWNLYGEHCMDTVAVSFSVKPTRLHFLSTYAYFYFDLDFIGFNFLMVITNFFRVKFETLGGAHITRKLRNRQPWPSHRSYGFTLPYATSFALKYTQEPKHSRFTFFEFRKNT